MIKTVGFNLFIKKLVQSSGNFGPSVCFLICVCGTVKTATLLSRVMWNRTCSRACHAAVFFRTSTGRKAFYPFTKFVLLNVVTLSLYRRFARNFRRECKKSSFGWHASLKNVVALTVGLKTFDPSFLPIQLTVPGSIKKQKGTRGTRVFPFPLPHASTSFFSSNAL